MLRRLSIKILQSNSPALCTVKKLIMLQADSWGTLIRNLGK